VTDFPSSSEDLEPTSVTWPASVGPARTTYVAVVDGAAMEDDPAAFRAAWRIRDDGSWEQVYPEEA
jgi:hypothetical protein